MRVLAIAANTFREAVRNKVMHAILGLALTVILCSKAMAWVSAGEDAKVMTDLGLSAITLFGVLVALFSGANLLYKEVDNRTSYLILSKPLRRYEFISGKYLGLISVLLACLAIMSAVHVGYLTSFVVPSEETPHLQVLRLYYIALGQAYFLIFLELCVIAALGVFFSAISSPVFSAVATFCAFFIGHGLRNLKDLTEVVESPAGDLVLKAFYWLLPGLFMFDIKHYAAYAQPRSIDSILWCVVYAAFYCTLVLAFTCAIFRRKQL
jgi:ABC-type transport system involved in multi-copper enzyme maturation permease subunit